jgi:hypothetical protein
VNTCSGATATATLANDDVPRAKPGHSHGIVNSGRPVDFGDSGVVGWSASYQG